MKRELDIGIDTIKDLKKRCVKILPGGDYGFAWNPVGTDARDMEHFVKLHAADRGDVKQWLVYKDSNAISNHRPFKCLMEVCYYARAGDDGME